MPSEALSLALAASIYPPALAVVIALGRGEEVRLRVVLFVIAAYLTVLCTGALMLFLFAGVHVAHTQIVVPTAALYTAAGVALLVLAVHLRRAPRRAPAKHAGASRTERYLRSRWLVLALGFVLYVVPSPIFAGAVKVLADTSVSDGQKLIYLVQLLVVMLWLIELPMLVLIAFPARGVVALERTNAWFARRGRELLVPACALLGVYLLVVGAVELATH
jgi:Sap, sulfolipid-1-addressing protein